LTVIKSGGAGPYQQLKILSSHGPLIIIAGNVVHFSSISDNSNATIILT